MINIIGMSIHGRDGLRAKAVKAALGADLLVGSRRHLDAFPEFKGEKVALGKLSVALEKMDAAIKAGKKITVLATGDPCLFGIGGLVTRRYGRRRVRIEPNVSVVQEAFARLGESCNDLKIISAHGRDMKAAIDAILENPKTAVFTDAVNTPGKIAKELLRRNASGFSISVFERLGMPGERQTTGSLETIARKKFNPLNVMVLINNAPVVKAARQRFGLPDDVFLHDNMITKEEVRAVTMAKLAVEEQSIVWDVGAGSGSISIEAALNATGGTVYAVEKRVDRVKLITGNIKKFGLSNTRVIKGVAPESLKKLPRPDRVFVGGAGPEIKKVLSLAMKKLLPGGRVVVNAVTIETMTVATDFFKRKGWDMEITSIAVSKAKKAGKVNILSALNPVFIIKAIKA